MPDFFLWEIEPFRMFHTSVWCYLDFVSLLNIDHLEKWAKNVAEFHFLYNLLNSLPYSLLYHSFIQLDSSHISIFIFIFTKWVWILIYMFYLNSTKSFHLCFSYLFLLSFILLFLFHFYSFLFELVFQSTHVILPFWIFILFYNYG